MIGNFAHDNGAALGYAGHGFYVTSSNILVANNISSNNAGNGFQIYAYNKMENVQILNNVAANNGWGRPSSGITLYTDGEKEEYFKNISIFNNILFRNVDAGITLNAAVGETISIKSNIIYGSASSFDVSSKTGAYTKENIFESDPQFVNGSGHYSVDTDYMLQSSSPAISKGLALEPVINDYVNNPRPVGVSPDIGAYEHQDH